MTASSTKFLGGAVVFFVKTKASAPGDVDVGFYRDMTTHHEQAIEISLLELAACEAEVRELAGRMARIQASRSYEMAQTAERLGLDIEVELAEVPPEP